MSKRLGVSVCVCVCVCPEESANKATAKKETAEIEEVHWHVCLPAVCVRVYVCVCVSVYVCACLCVRSFWVRVVWLSVACYTSNLLNPVYQDYKSIVARHKNTWGTKLCRPSLLYTPPTMAVPRHATLPHTLFIACSNNGRGISNMLGKLVTRSDINN